MNTDSHAPSPVPLFPGYSTRQIETDDGVAIQALVGGSGPPLLLLHGHPQTHAIWHKVAPALAPHFTLVLADLRGYGASSKPAGTPDHGNYSKRTMGRDMLRLMRGLGHARFKVLAHDRGARVAHRLAADHPAAVQRMVLLDIAPTLAMYDTDHRGLCTRLLALVLPDPARPAARAPDRGRPRRLRARGDGQPQRRPGPLRPPRPGRLPGRAGPARRRTRPVRRLPRRRRHRPGARPRRPRGRPEARPAAEGPVGRPGRGAALLSAAGRMAPGGQPGQRRRPCPAATTSPKKRPRPCWPRPCPSCSTTTDPPRR